MNDDNVVVFPKRKKNTPPQSLEEIRNSIDNARKQHVEILLDEFMSYITSRAYEEGFDFTITHTFKSTFFVQDAIRAALYKTKEIEHPLHQIIDKHIEDDIAISVEQAMEMLDDGEDQ